MARPGFMVPGIFGWAVLTATLAPSAIGQSPPATPQVRVAAVEAVQVADWRDYPGVAAAVKQVEVRAQVDGLLAARHFQEGREVAAGDLLFTIDPASYRLTVARGEASVESAAATVRFTEAETARYERLAKGGAASEEQRQQAAERHQTARAELAVAQAALASAQLDLSRTQIQAPFSGRADRAQVQAGDFVSAGTTTLVRLTQLNPIRVAFNPPERDAALIVAALPEGGGKALATLPETGGLTAGLSDGPARRFSGSVDYAASGVDPATGTLPMSATFFNPDHGLRPGAFVPVSIHLADKNVLVVPEEAIYGNASGRYVVAVESGVVSHVPVETGERWQDRRIVRGALAAGGMVVVSDAGRLQPGMKVQTSTGEKTP